MSTFSLVIIFFFYGLAFFSMGLVTSLEAGRASGEQLRRALRYLGAFGLLHGLHEWYEIFLILELLPGQSEIWFFYEWLRVGFLVISFLPLTTFGLILITSKLRRAPIIWAVPGAQLVLWGIALLVAYPGTTSLELPNYADVLARYILAIPAALLAAVGLRRLCVSFHRDGLAHYGYNCTWAALCFAFYGAIGQLFVRQTSLPISSFLNQELFLNIFGFPIQLLRALAALLIAFFILRFLRSLEREIQHNIRRLQEDRIRSSQRREALRGDLLKRVVGAQEAERQRIARELHDETGQALTAVGMGLQGLETKVGSQDAQILDNISSLKELVTQSMAELQRIISDLRPSHLDDLGLRAALRWYVNDVNERSGIHITLEMHGREHDLTSEAKMALFRTAQEAITNVVKHAQATTIEVILSYLEQGVQLTIRDNGIGFDLQRVQQRRDNWGLLGMHERASLMGGEFNIVSEPSDGTYVEVYIPYHPVEEEHNGNSIITGG
jgi:signal transduction histidine kinase